LSIQKIQKHVSSQDDYQCIGANSPSHAPIQVRTEVAKTPRCLGPTSWRRTAFSDKWSSPAGKLHLSLGSFLGIISGPGKCPLIRGQKLMPKLR